MDGGSLLEARRGEGQIERGGGAERGEDLFGSDRRLFTSKRYAPPFVNLVSLGMNPAWAKASGCHIRAFSNILSSSV